MRIFIVLFQSKPVYVLAQGYGVSVSIVALV
jgi:hypothetical protein